MRTTKPLIWAIGVLSAFVLTTMVAVQTNLVLAQDTSTFKIAAAAKKAKAKKAKKVKKTKQTKKTPAAKGKGVQFTQTVAGFPIAVISGKKYYTTAELNADGYIIQKHKSGMLFVDRPDCDINVAYKGSTGEEYDNGYTDGWNLRNQEVEQYGEGFPKKLVVPPGGKEYQRAYAVGYHEHPFMALQKGCRIAEVLDPATRDEDGWKKYDESLVVIHLPPSAGLTYDKTVKKDDAEGQIVEYALNTSIFGNEVKGKAIYTSGPELESYGAEGYADAILAGVKQKAEAASTADKVVRYSEEGRSAVTLPYGQGVKIAYKLLGTNFPGTYSESKITVQSTVVYAVKKGSQTMVWYEFVIDNPGPSGATHDMAAIENFIAKKMEWK